MTHNTLLAAMLVCGALAGTPTVATAQEPAAPPADPHAAAQAAIDQPAAQPSSMQVTPLKIGWLLAPDVRLSRVDHKDAVLVGGYGGWVTEGALLVGGGGYWLANGSDDLEMAYGGLVLEWLARTDKRIGFGARGLVGGGTATVGLRYTDLFGPVALDGAPVRFGHGGMHGRHGIEPSNLVNRSYRVSENFFVAEPQANVLLNVTDWMRINAGVGYRFIGGTSFLEDRLSGVSGSIAVEFGGNGF